MKPLPWHQNSGAVTFLFIFFMDGVGVGGWGGWLLASACLCSFLNHDNTPLIFQENISHQQFGFKTSPYFIQHILYLITPGEGGGADLPPSFSCF